MIDGEQTVTTTRTHVKVLFIPVIILLAVAAAGAFLAARIGNDANGVPRWVVISVALPDGSTLEGRAEDVDDLGRLVVDGTPVSAGDITHVRPAASGS